MARLAHKHWRFQKIFWYTRLLCWYWVNNWMANCRCGCNDVYTIYTYCICIYSRHCILLHTSYRSGRYSMSAIPSCIIAMYTMSSHTIPSLALPHMTNAHAYILIHTVVILFVIYHFCNVFIELHFNCCSSILIINFHQAAPGTTDEN